MVYLRDSCIIHLMNILLITILPKSLLSHVFFGKISELKNTDKKKGACFDYSRENI